MNNTVKVLCKWRALTHCSLASRVWFMGTRADLLVRDFNDVRSF